MTDALGQHPQNLPQQQVHQRCARGRDHHDQRAAPGAQRRRQRT
jgi:hypothetical protein